MLGAQSVQSVVLMRKMLLVREIISVFLTLLGVLVLLDLWGKIARQVRLYKLGSKYQRELKQTHQVLFVRESTSVFLTLLVFLYCWIYGACR